MRKTENKTKQKLTGHGAVRNAQCAGLVGLLLVFAGQGAMAQSGNPFRQLLGLEPKQEEQAQAPQQAQPTPLPNAAPAQRPSAQVPTPHTNTLLPPRRPASANAPAVSAEPPLKKPEERKTGNTAQIPFGTAYRPLESSEFVPFSQPEPMQLQPKPLSGKAAVPVVPANQAAQPEPRSPVMPAPSAEVTPPEEQDSTDQPVAPPPQAEAQKSVKAPLPPPAPRRPAANDAASADPATVPPQGVQGNAVPPPAALPPVSNLTDRQIVERANAYFNATDTLQANFTQLAGGSQRTTGTLYLERPGRIRFAYNPPSTMEIVSDGKNVAIRDSKLNTSDVYSINQTPLKFLLRDPINLGSDLKVVEIERDPTSIQITLEDAATIGGKAQITLFFDPQVANLTRWQIMDAQGFLTTVILSQMKRTKRNG